MNDFNLTEYEKKRKEKQKTRFLWSINSIEKI